MIIEFSWCPLKSYALILALMSGFSDNRRVPPSWWPMSHESILAQSGHDIASVHLFVRASVCPVSKNCLEDPRIEMCLDTRQHQPLSGWIPLMSLPTLENSVSSCFPSFLPSFIHAFLHVECLKTCFSFSIWNLVVTTSTLIIYKKTIIQSYLDSVFRSLHRQPLGVIHVSPPKADLLWPWTQSCPSSPVSITSACFHSSLAIAFWNSAFAYLSFVSLCFRMSAPWG